MSWWKLFKAATKPPRQTSSVSQRSASAVQTKRPQSYATILKNGHFHEIPKEEVDRLLAAYGEQLKAFRPRVRKSVSIGEGAAEQQGEPRGDNVNESTA